MPNLKGMVRLGNGLLVPQSAFPGLLPYTGGNQLDGISPIAIPVILVADATNVSAANPDATLPALDTGTTSPPAQPSLMPTPSIAGTTLWVPYGAGAVGAPTAAVFKSFTVPAGWAVMIEELVVAFTSATTLTVGASLFDIHLTPGTTPSSAAAGAGSYFSPAEWTYGFRKGAGVAATAYVAVFSRKGNNNANAYKDSFQWIADAAWTVLDVPTLPDFLLSEAGGLGVYITDGSAASHPTNVAIRAVLSWYKF